MSNFLVVFVCICSFFRTSVSLHYYLYSVFTFLSVFVFYLQFIFRYSLVISQLYFSYCMTYSLEGVFIPINNQISLNVFFIRVSQFILTTTRNNNNHPFPFSHLCVLLFPFRFFYLTYPPLPPSPHVFVYPAPPPLPPFPALVTNDLEAWMDGWMDDFASYTHLSLTSFFSLSHACGFVITSVSVMVV